MKYTLTTLIIATSLAGLVASQETSAGNPTAPRKIETDRNAGPNVPNYLFTPNSLKSYWDEKVGDNEHGIGITNKQLRAGFTAEVAFATHNYYNGSKSGLKYWVLSGDQTNKPVVVLLGLLQNAAIQKFTTKSRNIVYFGPLAPNTVYTVVITDPRYALSPTMGWNSYKFIVPSKPNNGGGNNPK